jgi:ketosteroid isomerase-like protein
MADTAIVARNNVELVREGYEAWNRGDRQWVLEQMSPDFEWITPPDDPDPGTHAGHEGVVDFWDQWREIFGLLKFDIEELVDADDRVVAVVRRLGIGNLSRVQVQERVIQVFTFREGKAVRCEEFYDRDEALASVGLGKAGDRTER